MTDFGAVVGLGTRARPEVSDVVPSERVPAPSNDVSGLDSETLTAWSGRDAADDGLSLFVVAEERPAHADDCLDPISDIAWLQFIDGLDVVLVFGRERDFFDTVVDDRTHESGLWLVDESGAVQRQWSLPTERREVLSIGRTVEREVGLWGDAK